MLIIQRKAEIMRRVMVPNADFLMQIPWAGFQNPQRLTTNLFHFDNLLRSSVASDV